MTFARKRTLWPLISRLEGLARPRAVLPLVDLGVRLASIVAGRAQPLERGEPYRPFFIVGSGRSGSTLLRRILAASPELHIPPENLALVCSIRFFRRNAYLPWNDLVRGVIATHELTPDFEAWGVCLRPLARRLEQVAEAERSLALILDGIYRFHGETKGQTFERWGDKTPLACFGVDAIGLVFPRGRFLCLLRDGVDVVASYLRAGLYPTMELAAQRWTTSLGVLESFARRHPQRCRWVRYEQLVGDPDAVVADLCRFLEVRFDPAMTRSSEHVAAMADIASIPHLANAARPITTSSVGRGRDELGASERATLERLIGGHLARHGYPPAR